MKSRTIRQAQVAGMFYPEDPDELRMFLGRLFEDFHSEEDELIQAQGCFVPHAGYIYSAECAAKTLASIVIPDTIILLHTKHTPQGAPLAISPAASWVTPLGPVAIADETAAMLDKLGPARFDETAHDGEHAGEVVLPFLQMLNPNARVCVVSVAHVDKPRLKALGHAIAQTCKHTDEREVLIIASTDMNHYASRIETEKLDDIALEQMEAMDPDGLIDAVNKHHISMCGASATAAMLHACKELGCSELTVVEHTDSGEASGDYARVVGYASGYVR